MAATKYVNFSGTGKWVKPYQPNQFGKWSLDLYMSKSEIERFKELKVMNHIKRDDDGDYVTFARPVEKDIRGKKVGMVPPTVTDKDGVPLSVAIGNGSKITVTLEYYSYQPPGKDQPKKSAVRLFAIRVDDLIPFATESLNELELSAVKELNKTPVPSWT